MDQSAYWGSLVPAVTDRSAHSEMKLCCQRPYDFIFLCVVHPCVGHIRPFCRRGQGVYETLQQHSLYHVCSL